MKQYIGLVIAVFSMIFLLNSGCGKDTEVIGTDVVPTDTTYTDTTNVVGDTIANPIDTIENPVDTVIWGCTDSTAANYNALATDDDGSCTYGSILGCTDIDAVNYDPTATEDDGSCEYPVAIVGDIDDLYNILSTPSTSNHTIDCEQFQVVYTPKGAIFYIEENSFVNLLGDPVEGQIDLEIIEIYTKGDMIRYKTPTISNNQFLDSDGEFFIAASQNGIELELAPGKTITGLIPNMNPNQDMQLFYADSDEEIFNWIEDPESPIWVSEWEDSTSTQGFGFGYEIIITQLDWINIDVFVDEPNVTDVNAFLPDRYTNQNAVVFLVLNDYDSVVSMYGNPDDESFISFNTPVGFNVTFVAIGSVSDDPDNPEYEFGMISNTIEQDHEEFIPMVPTSIEDIEAALEGL